MATRHVCSKLLRPGYPYVILDNKSGFIFHRRNVLDTLWLLDTQMPRKARN